MSGVTCERRSASSRDICSIMALISRCCTARFFGLSLNSLVVGEEEQLHMKQRCQLHQICAKSRKASSRSNESTSLLFPTSVGFGVLRNGFLLGCTPQLGSDALLSLGCHHSCQVRILDQVSTLDQVAHGEQVLLQGASQVAVAVAEG